MFLKDACLFVLTHKCCELSVSIDASEGFFLTVFCCTMSSSSERMLRSCSFTRFFRYLISSFWTTSSLPFLSSCRRASSIFLCHSVTCLKFYNAVVFSKMYSNIFIVITFLTVNQSVTFCAPFTSFSVEMSSSRPRSLSSSSSVLASALLLSSSAFLFSSWAFALSS